MYSIIMFRQKKFYYGVLHHIGENFSTKFFCVAKKLGLVKFLSHKNFHVHVYIQYVLWWNPS